MPVPDLPQSSAPTSPAVSDLTSLMRAGRLGRAGVASGAISKAPNEAFFLRHHPRCWQVSMTLEQPTLLPEVTKHVLAVGVNGVRTLGEHDSPEMAYEDSIRAFEKQGWRYLSPLAPIPADCLPPGVPVDGGYLRELDCRHPLTGQAGVFHVEAWDVPISSLPDEDQQFRFHRESYERWLRYLVLTGQVEPPNQRVIDSLVARVRDHVSRAKLLNVAPDIRAEFIKRRTEIHERYAAATLPVATDEAPEDTDGGRKRRTGK